MEPPGNALPGNGRKRAAATMLARPANAEVVLADLASTMQRLFEYELPASVAVALAPEQALEHAKIAFECALGGEEDRDAALAILAVELLASVRLELARDIPAARRLVDRIEDEVGVHRGLLVRELLRTPELLSLPPMASVSAQLTLLSILAPLDEVSLWHRDEDGQLQCICQVGGRPQVPEVVEFARSLLTRRPERAWTSELIGIQVEFWQQPLAALIGRSEPTYQGVCRHVMAEAVPMLAAILERDDLLTRRSEIEQAVGDSRDRKVTRLGLDLHDGPLQDVAALAGDLRLLRRQLELTLKGHEHEQLLGGRIDDLDAQLVAIDADIRRLAVSLQSPFLAHRDFVRALHETGDWFKALTGSPPRLVLTGDLSTVSDSQQLALLAILREALNNVREHSDATEVTVSVAGDSAGVHAELTDNGSGFDVESTLLRAARGGHVGLVGMQERVRLLNGQSHIDSRPGGPTTITVSMPRWEPAR